MMATELLHTIGVIGVAIILALVLTNRKEHDAPHPTSSSGPPAQDLFIDTYSFPSSVSHRVQSIYPHLSVTQVEQVMQGLRQFFAICKDAGQHTVALPSQVVDVAWHELILSTKAYEEFCQRAFGRFLHHTPAEVMKGTDLAPIGIKNAWYYACRREGIDPKAPSRLPLIFALDADLDIADGYKYSRDCTQPGGYAHCAMHIGCAWIPGEVDDSTSLHQHTDTSIMTGKHSGEYDAGGHDVGGAGCGASCGGGCGAD